MLPRKSIQEFQELYQKEFGQTISFDEAEKQANNLIQLYKSVLSKPNRPVDTKAQYDN